MKGVLPWLVSGACCAGTRDFCAALPSTKYYCIFLNAHYFWTGCCACLLKGQCHEIFDFWFFSRISFPQAPEYTIRVVSNFFENSRRYSQLKVCHRGQMQKIFNHKSFHYLVWTPVWSIVNLWKHFCQVHFKVSAAWYCFHYLPPVSLTPVANLRRCRWYRWQIATGVVDTGGKFAAGVVDTGGK